MLGKDLHIERGSVSENGTAAIEGNRHPKAQHEWLGKSNQMLNLVRKK